MKYSNYNEMKFSVLKSDLMISILNMEYENTKNHIQELYNNGFLSKSILEFVYKMVNNHIQITSKEYMVYLFTEIDNIYNMNLDVESYAVLTTFYINEQTYDEVKKTNIEQLLNDNFIDNCEINFIILFLSYYLESLISSSNIDTEKEEIIRINNKLKEKMDQFELETGRKR